MAGGTGGHIFPALAVAKELAQRGATVDWLGTAQGMEARIIPAENITFHSIGIKGFRGKGIVQKLLMPLLLCRAVFQAIAIIRTVKPSVVVGFGGFVAAPGGIAAKLMGKPLVIHEQNSVAGTSNRLLAKIAQRKLVAFPDVFKHALHVGNPVRATITQLESRWVAKEPTKLRVLIMGGSLGAKAINDVVPFSLADIDKSIRPDIWHQTGRNKCEPVQQAYHDKNVDARVEEFISDVAEAYAWADVLICRAGALTVSEVAVAGVPAIFVPLPSAIDNHQYFNAKWLSDNGAAILVEQKELTQERLTQQLLELNSQREKLQEMHIKLKTLALPNATLQVANHCEELCDAS
jgi:UDP-N-acetylglucosamine--N-acetylmuramyl-(pentapeptide) pyrophosphoryl-undecaprenol N-acetylglucosamine transferase